EHGEILGEHEHGAAVHRSPAGDDAVAGDFRLLHAELVAAVLDEHVELLERVAVEEERDALARGELAAFVLGFDALLAAAQARVPAAMFELSQNVLHRALCGRFSGANCIADAPKGSNSSASRPKPGGSRALHSPGGGGSAASIPRAAG